MDASAFTAIYTESRNGCNGFYHHPLSIGGRFEFSDGVKELADLGCFWLLDILATECLKPLRASGEAHSIVTVAVGADSKALITLKTGDDAPPIWRRSIDWTDMPAGQWEFELVDEGDRFALILITEH